MLNSLYNLLLVLFKGDDFVLLRVNSARLSLLSKRFKSLLRDNISHVIRIECEYSSLDNFKIFIRSLLDDSIEKLVLSKYNSDAFDLLRMCYDYEVNIDYLSVIDRLDTNYSPALVDLLKAIGMFDEGILRKKLHHNKFVDQELKLMDRETFLKHSENISKETFAFSGHTDGTIRLWNITNDTLIYTFNHCDVITQTSYCSSGRLLAVIYNNDYVKVFSLDDMSLIKEIKQLHQVISVKIRNGLLILLRRCQSEGRLDVRSIFSEAHYSFNANHAYSMDISKNGMLLVFNDLSSVFLLEVPTERLLFSRDFSFIERVKLSPEGGFVVVVSHKVFIWHFQKDICLVLEDDIRVETITIHPREAIMMAISSEGDLAMWNAETLERIRILKNGLPEPSTGYFSPNGDKVYLANEDGITIFCKGSYYDSLPYKCLEFPSTIVFSPSGEKVIVITYGTKKRTDIFYDGPRKIFGSLGRGIRAAFFVEEETVIFIRKSRISQLQEFDPHAWDASILLEEKTALISLGLTPDSYFLFSHCEDHTLKFWDFKKKFLYRSLECKYFAFSSDNETIACVKRKGIITIMPYVHVERNCTELDNGSSLTALTFSKSEANILASSGKDCIIRIWDTKRGALLYELPRYGSPAIRIALHNKQNEIIFVSKAGWLKIWNIKERRIIHMLNLHEDLNFSWISNDGEVVAFASKQKLCLMGIRDEKIKYKQHNYSAKYNIRDGCFSFGNNTCFAIILSGKYVEIYDPKHTFRERPMIMRHVYMEEISSVFLCP